MFNIKNSAKNHNEVISDICYLSRQDKLSPYFYDLINSNMPEYRMIDHSYNNIENTMNDLIDYIVLYSRKANVNDFVLGVSGGADSSVCFALLNEAKKVNKNIKIHAYTLPIHQIQTETDRANEVADFLSLGIKNKDLSKTYDAIREDIMEDNEDNATNRIRKGNIKARTRMSYLYDKARTHNGVVVSTDNFSEYLAGFWTINGDVGDISPIQNCFKSFEVTGMGRSLNLPEKIWRAIPTDGLGISNSDETQLGMSYFEWDILSFRMLITFTACCQFYSDIDEKEESFKSIFISEFLSDELMKHKYATEEDTNKVKQYFNRVNNSWYKRLGTIKFDNTSFFKNAVMEAFNNIITPEDIDRIYATKG